MKRITQTSTALFGISAILLSSCQSPTGASPGESLAQLDGGLGLGKIQVLAGVVASAEDTLSVARINVIQVQIRGLDGKTYTFQEAPFELRLDQLNIDSDQLMNRARLPDGQYDHIRLVTEEFGSAELNDGSIVPLRVPSGPQTGIKIFLDQPLSVEGGRITRVRLKFDVARSFVLVQGGAEMLFKPVIHAQIEEITEGPGGETGGGETGGSTGGSTSGGGETGGSSTGGETGGSTGGDSGGSTGGGSTGGGEEYPIIIGT